jgi:hypothetical protein
MEPQRPGSLHRSIGVNFNRRLVILSRKSAAYFLAESPAAKKCLVPNEAAFLSVGFNFPANALIVVKEAIVRSVAQIHDLAPSTHQLD